MFKLWNFNTLISDTQNFNWKNINVNFLYQYTIPKNEIEFLNNQFDLYHYTTPNVKLYYPEPFIASPTFSHDDIWFLHIVIYQYWLWFFFIFLIIFFFITFLVTVRWCNIRFRPARETRGVSRSKCGDLITATVPVSWATSIIIHESTDAIELADGFGTTELAIGIRAYQWGWEYYYPKDLNFSWFNTNKNFLIGNSLKYPLNFSNEKKSFKKNILNNTQNSETVTPFFLFNKSISLASITTLYNNILLNSNRLMNETSSCLIKNNKKTNVSVSLYDINTSFSLETQRKLNLYLKFYFISNLQNRFYNDYSQYNYLPQLSQFSHSQSFINLKFWNYINDVSNQNTNNSRFNLNLFSDLLFSNNWLVSSDVFNSETTTDKWLSNNFYFKPNVKFNYILKNLLILNKFNFKFPSLLANQDFKRWASFELFEDFFWDLTVPSNNYTEINQKNVTIFDSIQTINITQIYQKEQSLFLFDNILMSNIGNTEIVFSKLTSFNFINIFNNISFLKNEEEMSWLKKIFYNNVFNDFNLNWFNLKYIGFPATSFNNILLNYNNIMSSINNIIKKTTPTLSSNLKLLHNNSTLDFISFNKNYNVFNQAFLKIFKSFIEEERNAATFFNFELNSNNLLNISTAPQTLFNSFNKNSKSELVLVNFFNPKFNTLENQFSLINNLSNYFNLNFPFSISTESDVIRYSWFDWYSLRRTVSTKALDTSLFGLHGTKYFAFNFTNNKDLFLLNQVDNYYNKFTQARRLLLPAYIHTPYFLNKYLLTTSVFIVDDLLLYHFYNISNFSNFLNISNWFDSSYLYLPFVLERFFFSKWANNHLPFTPFYRNVDNISARNVTLTTLLDTLYKREMLFKKLTIFKKQTLINTDYVVSYKNVIFNDFKMLFTLQEEQTELLSKTKLFIPTTLKTQYQAFKKGISNMIRIQADKAIAMPIETRLQILAVSKDIIHSWAIPSAGVKIDCIPGYSSHRVIVFLVAGVYWGQCMEICGRFHHWMPIVVYFMKRDLFFLWCTHFILANNQSQYLNQSILTNKTSSNIGNWESWQYEFN